MNTTTNTNESPIIRKRRRTPRLPLSTKQIQREIVLKEAARRKTDQEIEQLKLSLAQNAREQTAERGQRVILKTLESLRPADVSTFIALLSPFITREQEVEDVQGWQEMHAEAAASTAWRGKAETDGSA